MAESLFSDYYSLTNELVVRKLLSDPEVLSLFRLYGFIPVDEIIPPDVKDQFYYLASVLIENDSHIKDNTVEQLVEDEFLYPQMQDIFARSEIPTKIIQYIFYNYKYAAVKVFFQKNYNRFMPNFDFEEINSREKVRLFVKSFLREFDKFADIINNLYEISDVDRVDEQYLSYLAQLVGYKKEDEALSKNVSFRQFIKNIVEIYKIKGTNYAFELYLNFLGFTCTVNEFWFDRRYYHTTGYVNEWTGQTDKTKFDYYFTPIKPTNGIPEVCDCTQVVHDDDISFIRNVYDFNRLALTVPVDQLLGYTSGSYTGEPFTFFKANYITYEVSKINNEGVIEAVTQDELATLVQYVNILVPIFIIKNVYLKAVPFFDFLDLSSFLDEPFTNWSNPIMDSLGNLYPIGSILSSVIPLFNFDDFHYLTYEDKSSTDEILPIETKVFSTIFDYYSIGTQLISSLETLSNTINMLPFEDNGSTYIREWDLLEGDTIGDLYEKNVSKTLFENLDIKIT
jgi:hypothetical protein